ncbi:MDR family MFS transporter [Cohnella fermenti]|uniref:Multidrug efflux MFS transporter n=1 Tax=Cohnella fermenti TaxID=2565925 RepID=A0A4S4BKH5_9BACL|nr:MDR family MFS transporter [Cohnella fermenti]THF75232.1 multidrug efflux MFS transporter [Cohnella fermenti]
MTTAVDNANPDIKKTPILVVLLIGSFVAILNQTLLATALPPIMNDFKIGLSTAQWLTTAFMLVNGIMVPITAFLIGRFSTRQLFISAMTLFAIGTLTATLSPNFTVLLIGRIVQALGAGVMMPLNQVVTLSLFPVRKRGAAMGLVGLVIGLGPAIGPTLAGVMIEHFHWRSLFLIVLPIVIADIALAFFIMKNVTRRTSPKMDTTSILLSTIGFGCLLYGFSSAGTSGWSSAEVLATLGIGLVGLLFFIVRQFKLEQPILEFRVFKDPIFTITTVLGIVTFTSMIGAEILIPTFMQNMLGYTALESGLALLPGAILMGVMMPITGKLFDKFGVRWLAIVGFALITATGLLFTRFETTTTLSYVLAVYMARMVGVSLVMMPLMTAGINRLQHHLIPHGTAMVNTMRQVGGSIGTAALVTVMSITIANANAPGLATMIDGINAAFLAATLISLVGVVLSFFVKGTRARMGEAAAIRGQGTSVGE